MALKLKFQYLMIIRLDNRTFISSPFENGINTKITKGNLIFSQTLHHQIRFKNTKKVETPGQARTGDLRFAKVSHRKG